MRKEDPRSYDFVLDRLDKTVYMRYINIAV